MKHRRTWLWLSLIWLASNIGDRLWLALDKTVPSWDQSNHLTGSLNYLQALQKPNFLNGSWWVDFWQLSSKYPPLTYILSAPFQQLLSKGNAQALAENFLSSAILIISVYILGKKLFNKQIGLLAAVLSVLFPRLYLERLTYLTDNLLVAMTIAAFTCLTLWRNEKKSLKNQWLYSVLFGIFWGLALLTKQSVMFFLLVPLLWVSCQFLFTGQWLRILQLLTSFFVSTLFWWPWYRTNWIYSFGTYSSSVTLPAAAQGNAPINTLTAWLYYWQDLPFAISWVLLLVPLVGIILNFFGAFPKGEKILLKESFIWLAIYWLGSYLICNLNINKNERYIIPYLPILAIFLAYGLTQWRGKWQTIQIWTITIAVLVMLGKLYPLPVLTQISQFLSPGGTNYPYTEKPWPDAEVIETITKTTPYLQATLGVIPNTAQVNHNTLNYYGALADFQVYGRELGSKTEQVQQDGNSLDWFLTKTGDNAWAKKPQLELAQKLEKDPDFSLVKTWTLPDQSDLKLYHRQEPLVTVKDTTQEQEKIELKEVIVPSVVPPNVPVPVTYHWVGGGAELKNGLVLISWQKDGKVGWIQDHALGMGELYQTNYERTLEVIEKTAMLPSGDVGEYHLQVTYLNPQTDQSYPIKTPLVTITTQIGAPIPQAPVLDKVTQLRQLSLFLADGIKGLDPIFLQVARLNQYDPVQNYLEQAAQTLAYRLEKHNLDKTTHIQYLYGLLLSRVLQQDATRAIPIVQKLMELQPNNPYLHAYLAVLYLYNWDSASAETAFKPIQGNKIKEIRILEGAINILRGHIFEGISILRTR